MNEQKNIAKVTTADRPVLSMTEKLASRISDLRVGIDALDDKLSPILASQPKPGSDVADAQEYPCLLENILDAHICNIELCIERITRIAERIRL